MRQADETGTEPPPSASDRLRHVIESRQFSRELLDRLLARASFLRDNPPGAGDRLDGRIMATLFYEPSTRTRLSFETAMLRMGGQTISTDHAHVLAPGCEESLEDTIRSTAYHVDVIVLRHYQEGAAQSAAAVSDVPVINAGDGRGQHPTQALLDVYTIGRELGHIDGISIAMVGDLANSRHMHSLAHMLARYDGVDIWVVAKPEVAMQPEIKDYLSDRGSRWWKTTDLEEVLPEVDVLYQTRIQKERLDDLEAYRRLAGGYRIDSDVMSRLRPGAILLHGLPRLNDIAREVDADPRAAYFRQARNGLDVRMALLEMVLARR